MWNFIPIYIPRTIQQMKYQKYYNCLIIIWFTILNIILYILRFYWTLHINYNYLHWLCSDLCANKEPDNDA